MTSVKLQDVADLSGVSLVTASRALSGRDGVSERTRIKVQEAADRLGYVSASAAKEKKACTIGVIVAQRYLSDRRSLYWALYQELSRCMVEKGHFSMLEIVSRQKEDRGELPAVLQSSDVDGVIVMGAFLRPYMGTLRSGAQVPVVFLDTPDLTGRYDSVISNSFLGGFACVNHLLDLGHKEIGFVGSLRVTSSIDDRFLGGQKALLQRGLSFGKGRIYEDRDRNTLDISASCIDLSAGNLPTAFFCNCDLTAGILVEKLGGMGLRVPEDISVVGFDNFTTDLRWRDFLTTYDVNMKEMAGKAVHVITHQIADPGYRNGLSIVQGEFLEKKSTERIGRAVSFAEGYTGL